MNQFIQYVYPIVEYLFRNKKTTFDKKVNDDVEYGKYVKRRRRNILLPYPF